MSIKRATIVGMTLFLSPSLVLPVLASHSHHVSPNGDPVAGIFSIVATNDNPVAAIFSILAVIVFAIVMAFINSRRQCKPATEEEKNEMVRECENWAQKLESQDFFPPETHILLQPDEIPLLEEPSTLAEARSVGVYGGGGTQINGIYIGAGESTSFDELKDIDSGTLTFTTQRLIFTGGLQQRVISIEDIVNALPYGGDAIIVNSQDRAKAQVNTVRNPVLWSFVIQCVIKGDLTLQRNLDGTFKLAPKHAVEFNNRGAAKGNNGDLDGAIADYTLAVKLDPKLAVAYSNRGVAYFQIRNWTDALADFNRCCELDSKDQKDARLFIWLIRARMGEKKAADKELSACIDRLWNDTPEDWASKIAGFFLDRISEADFLAAAASPDVETERGQVCEAWFYAGIKRLLAGDSTTAADDFSNCLATGLKNLSAYQSAQAELKALHAPHLTAKNSTSPIADSANAEQTRGMTDEEMATGAQLSYLSDLGVEYDPATLTKADATRLIDHALAANRPSESQMDRLRRLGFVLKDGEGFTMRELDEILNSARQSPDPQDLAKLQSLKIDLSNGNALDCRLMIELDEAFLSDDEFSPLGPIDIARACAEAAKDPDLFKVRLRRSAAHGGLVFSWPQAKLRQWAASSGHAS